MRNRTFYSRETLAYVMPAERSIDIDEAWQSGLAELNAAGFNLSDLPLFLVLGVPEEESAKSLLAASSLKLDVTAVPAGEPAALRWFAGPNACVLVISHAGRLSRLVERAGEEPSAGLGGASEAPLPPYGTLQPPPEYRRTAAPGMLPSELHESFSPTSRSSMAEEQGSITSIPSSQPAFMAGGTLTPDVGAQAREQFPRSGLAAQPARRLAPLALSKDQAETATARLDHVCRLLREERSPLCPVNGLLMVLPFELVVRCDQDFHISVRTDLSTLRSGLRVRSQVVALFAGMEREAGFRELKRRVGPKVANEQQFGKGYNPHCPSIDEELAAVVQHACGAFEDWTFFLYSKRDERLSNPRGNRQLYALVCKIRSQQQRLEDVIVKGFAANGDSAEKPHMFSGCYFAATGDKDDRRAFVPGVFRNRLLAQDEDVEWTNDALAENDWYQWSANLLVALDMLLIGGIATMIWRIWHNQG
jgi:hypothetical protein